MLCWIDCFDMRLIRRIFFNDEGDMPKVVGINEDDLQLIKHEYTRMGSSDPRSPYSNLHEMVLFFPTQGAENVFLRDMNSAAEQLNEETKARHNGYPPPGHEMIHGIHHSSRLFGMDNRSLVKLVEGDNPALYAQNFHEQWEFTACLEKAGYEIVPVDVKDDKGGLKKPEQLIKDIKSMIAQIKMEELGMRQSPNSALGR